MGCDWYRIKHISAVGFFVPFDTKEYEKSLETLMSNENYGCILCPDTEDGEKLILRLFIYDKRTLFRTNLSIPGPYEITLSDHYTVIQEHNTKGYSDEIENMSLDFNKKCSYWNLLTTMGVGHFFKDSKDIDINFFKTIKEYKEHFGYVSY
jgi:hypothetical protein